VIDAMATVAAMISVRSASLVICVPTGFGCVSAVLCDLCVCFLRNRMGCVLTVVMRSRLLEGLFWMMLWMVFHRCLYSPFRVVKKVSSPV
jgi:hypothetical protein